MVKKSKQSTALSTGSMNPEMAERHMAAYTYAATGECSCPACEALRPLAKLFYEKYRVKKTKTEVSESGQAS